MAEMGSIQHATRPCPSSSLYPTLNTTGIILSIHIAKSIDEKFRQPYQRDSTFFDSQRTASTPVAGCPGRRIQWQAPLQTQNEKRNQT